MRFSLVAVALSCSLVMYALANAQDAGVRQLPGAVAPRAADVITGADFGFRIVEMRGNRAVGEFVVRVNGRWIEAEPSVRMRPLH